MIYETTCVVLLCCKSHTHAANIKFQPNACSSCFKQYFPFLLPNLNPNPNPLLNSLPVLIILSVKSIASSHCIEDTPGNTLVHTLIDVKYSPARRVSRKLRPKSKTIPCYTSDASSHLVYCSLIHRPN